MWDDYSDAWTTKYANKAHLPPRAISKKTTGLASAMVELNVCRCDEEGSLHLDRSLMSLR